ncbi:MAG TPA: hypothetical protein VMN60_03015 [Longimicrobiales bacterium]|nr:hypothetical protein [Longimicrobiales bacterium]
MTLLFLGVGSGVWGQERVAAVAVFLDCQTFGCDSEHVRNEIRFVNWVRERTVADVHVLVTSQGAGGGGTAYQLAFIGARAFADDSVTLAAAVNQNATESERRDLVTNRIAQGLLRYATRTAAADRIRIEFAADGEAARGLTDDGTDPWNYWVFGARLNGSIEGASRSEVQELELSFDASRVTAEWKLNFEIEGTHEKERLELRDRTVTRLVKDYEANGLVARALAPLWSAGLGFEVGRSTFENQKFYARAATALEYSFFPYEEFSRRQLTLQYSFGSRYFEYDEITIYDRVEEQRYDHSLELEVEYQQPWGSARTGISGSQYLHDFSRYSVTFDGNVDVRLFRGFSLEISGRYSRVHDQLYIPKGDADDDDILLRLRDLETNYRYDTSIGIRYTFGSVYNNVVNPRLDRGGGRDRR